MYNGQTKMLCLSEWYEGIHGKWR